MSRYHAIFSLYPASRGISRHEGRFSCHFLENAPRKATFCTVYERKRREIPGAVSPRGTGAERARPVYRSARDRDEKCRPLYHPAGIHAEKCRPLYRLDRVCCMKNRPLYRLTRMDVEKSRRVYRCGATRAEQSSPVYLSVGFLPRKAARCTSELLHMGTEDRISRRATRDLVRRAGFLGIERGGPTKAGTEDRISRRATRNLVQPPVFLDVE